MKIHPDTFRFDGSGQLLIAFSPTGLQEDMRKYRDVFESKAELMGYHPWTSVYCLEHLENPLWDPEDELEGIRSNYYRTVWIAGVVLTPKIQEVCMLAFKNHIPIYNHVDEADMQLHKYVEWFVRTQRHSCEIRAAQEISEGGNSETRTTLFLIVDNTQAHVA